MIYDLIKNRVQISDIVRAKVELKKRGNDYIGLCPFHSEKTPSFTVNNLKRFFYCFGCHNGGDVISFVSQTTGLSYREAALKLANDYRIEIPSSAALKQELDEFDQIHSVLELSLEFYKNSLTPEAISYLNKRGINQALIDKFQIGYAPGNNLLRKYLEAKKIPLLMLDKAGLMAKKEGSIYEVFRERVIFPIRNNHNKLIAFGGRTLKDIQPKYLNSPETLLFKKNESLYGENFAYTHCYKNNRAILVEGYIDLIKMHSSGFVETVATLGTAVNEKHLDKLWSVADEIIMCLDGDQAGLRASQRVVELALPKVKANKYISFVMLPKSYDPDDVLKEKGAGYMESLIQKRLGLSKMIWMLETADSSFYSAELIAKLELKLNGYVQHIKDNLVAKSYKRFFNDQLWLLTKTKKQKNVKIANLPQQLEHNNLLELALIALLIKYPELFDNEGIAQKIKDTQFSPELAAFVNPEQVQMLASKIFPIIQKSDPGFEASLSKCSPQQVFLKMLKQYNLFVLEKRYKALAASDPKKFLEIYDTYKIDVDRLLQDCE
jgi:DNA primase